MKNRPNRAAKTLPGFYIEKKPYGAAGTSGYSFSIRLQSIGNGGFRIPPGSIKIPIC